MNKILVKCEKLDDFGRGICKLQGKVMFVSNFLPGEEAYVKITLEKKKFLEGEVLSLVKKSPDRVLSLCPYEGDGCSLKHLKYEKALEYKENKVKNILKKFAGLDGVVKRIIPAFQVWGYRNKVTLKVQGRLGYYKTGTHDFKAIDKYYLANEKVNEVISILNKEDLSEVSEVIIKAYDEVMVIIKGNVQVNNLKRACDSIYLNDKLVYGKKYVLSSILDDKFYVGKDAFFQVNKEMTEKLYSKVLDSLPKDKNKKVLDLYCGTGTIGIFLSKYFKEVIGIEINKDAIDSALMNKEVNKANNVKFILGDVALKLEFLKDYQADIVTLDPPRAGLGKKCVSDVLNIGPEMIVYVSCDPVTLARDLKLFGDDYEVLEVTPFDMFPQTYHVENVAVLKKK